MKNKNDSCSSVFSEIKNYLEPISFKKIQLILEAISCNFHEVINKDGEKTSKDWEDSFEIYQNISKLIIENLFDVSDASGFPKAKVFVAVYMDEKPNATIGEMVVYFLRKKLNSFDNE